MRSSLVLIGLSLFGTAAFAQNPKQTTIDYLLGRAQTYYTAYAVKTPEQIYDGQYDDSDYLVLSTLEYGENSKIFLDKRGSIQIELATLKLMAAAFSGDQLTAISKAAADFCKLESSNNDCLKKIDYIAIAQQLKAKTIDDGKAYKAISKLLY